MIMILAKSAGFEGGDSAKISVNGSKIMVGLNE